MGAVLQLALIGVLIGGFLAIKGSGGLRSFGWKLSLGCLAVAIGVVLLSDAAVWAGHHWPVLLALALMAGALAVLVWKRDAFSGRSRPAKPSDPIKGSGDHHLAPSFDPFVGKSDHGRLITVSAEDTIGVIGPPRAGKTAGILIPQAMMWAGPMISVSVKEDILLATGDQRTTIARPFGGNIHVFDPTDGSKPEIEAMGPHHPSLFVRWSPIAGCEVPETAKLRAEAMVGASFGGEDGATAQRNTHFEHRASMILRTMFHAAALSDAAISDVLGWIDSQDFMEPASRIRDSESTEKGWVSELLGLAQIAPEERGSSFSTAANAMDAFRLSTVQRNCAATDLDLRSFIQRRSTLYVVAGASMQKAIAPLFSALIESIAFACIDELAREGGGRLEPRLLLQLDEIANIAPLPNLQRLLTLCGGRGVCLSYAGQSWRQLASRYGQDSMRSIWQSTKAQLVFGGVGDAEMLRELEELMGKTKEKKVTRSHKAHLPTGASVSVSKEDEARLHLDQIYSDPDHAFLFYRGDYQHITPAKIFDASLGRPFAAAAGWTPSNDLAGFS